MFKKIFIAVAVGALLSPVGLAFSRTGGKGLSPRGGTTYCSHKARAAGGTHPSCVVTVRTTVTKYKTVYHPVTTTKTVNHTTTSTTRRTYTTTTTLGGGATTVVVTKTIGQTYTVPGQTFTTTVGGGTDERQQHDQHRDHHRSHVDGQHRHHDDHHDHHGHLHNRRLTLGGGGARERS